ncbi:endonuclease III domain-containing protein [Lacticaseibacillus zhaodongensis]|uniref:endonuclease III domain-containing protein n=1 Tax=Lacticaseibacillus zhaodongensis TaxID=2668065 RepID=UPI0012D2D367|nr:endonuclease III [Lacticaseibacillus zhaodongensis]
MAAKLRTITVNNLYEILYDRMGPRHWWPAGSTVQLICGMILIQNTNWRNVDRALINLNAATNFGLGAILALSDEELQELIRPSGFYKAKTRYLRTALTMYRDDYQTLTKLPTAKLRKHLRTLPGIGNETADVLLLYVFMRSAFVADSYTRRLFNPLAGLNANYQQLQTAVAPHFDLNVVRAQEFHALLDDYGKLGTDAFDLIDRYRLQL